MSEGKEIVSHVAQAGGGDFTLRLHKAEQELHRIDQDLRHQGTLLKEIHEAIVGNSLDPDDKKGLVKKVKYHGQVLKRHLDRIDGHAGRLSEAEDAIDKLEDEVEDLKTEAARFKNEIVPKLESELKLLKEHNEKQKDNKLGKYEGIAWGVVLFIVGKLLEAAWKAATTPLPPSIPGAH